MFILCWWFHDLDIEATIKSIDRILEKANLYEDCFRMECRGEITLYPQLIRHLEKKAEHGYRIEILTNGTNLDVLSNDSKLKISSIAGWPYRKNEYCEGSFTNTNQQDIRIYFVK